MTDISYRIGKMTYRAAAWFALSLLTAGCTNDDGDDYCKNHYRFHEAHRSSVAQVSIVLSEDGVLDATLVLPDGSGEQLSAPRFGSKGAAEFESILHVQSADACQEPEGGGSMRDGVWRISYQAQCGAGNKIEQIDFGIFELLPSVDEVEVDVTTPATQKHFAISRACEQAIYRLKPPETARD